VGAIAHLGRPDFVAEQEDVPLLGPPGTGETHPALRAGLAGALRRLGCHPLLVVERASPFVTSKKPFGRWAEGFGDDVVATVMIARLVHPVDSDGADAWRSGRGDGRTRSDDGDGPRTRTIPVVTGQAPLEAAVPLL
jgi:IstB-like ATP binding protein